MKSNQFVLHVCLRYSFEIKILVSVQCFSAIKGHTPVLLNPVRIASNGVGS